MSQRTARTKSITAFIGAGLAPAATALQPRNDQRTPVAVATTAG